ncbi:hypothetical protein EPHNCH_1014 [Anaplasma phagocytophilum str. NCH-1]|uniref:Uncharacterized protein n=1 Tax=Anaplasma phagocytophilum str. NCH-1 TaxID=1359161 RepID=A0A0F3N6E4_ANAPH|nr:hypothetical protein EPHNCH_1014 [Anaplasma phagocytophilum str. NCH-1]
MKYALLLRLTKPKHEHDRNCHNRNMIWMWSYAAHNARCFTT